jgi:hypothetical protein
MSHKLILLILAILALVTMACGITVNIPMPVEEIKTGPTEIEEINVPESDVSVVDLTLVFGAGKLDLKPGATGALVAGTASYNVEDLKPRLNVSAEKVRIESGDLNLKGIPNFDNNVENNWDLMLSQTPMNLTINAGAYQGDLELGGLALKSLEVSDGAADVRLKFSEPNLEEMDTLRYITGASSVNVSGLANANFTSMIFRSGAGDYTLDFSGQLQRDAVVTVESGISQVVIVVPEGVAAKVIFNGGLTGVSKSGQWSQTGNTYTQPGEGPQLTINVDMGAGNLELRSK